jgi:hypothetical protein
LALGTKALEVTNSGVVGGSGGESRLYEADTVIYAVGQNPLQDEAMAFSSCAPEFHILGDCVTPKTIYNATSAAYEISRSIGVYIK